MSSAAPVSPSPTPSTTPGPGLFRAHVDDRQQNVEAPGGAGIFVQLGQEWIRLGALPSMASTLRRWGRAEPALADTASLGALVDRIDASHGAEEDGLLLALVRLAQSGQQLAGRVVLQAMLPKLARMARTVRPSSNDDRWVEDRRHIAVATFWEVLYAYPTDRRPGRVAGNLALDTLHELTRDQRKPAGDIPVDPEEAADRLAGSGYHEPRMQASGLTADSDLLEVIAWGLDVAAISSDEAVLLTRVYLPDPYAEGGSADLAQTLGLSAAAVRQRCSRARRRLISAVQADLEPQRPVLLPACA